MGTSVDDYNDGGDYGEYVRIKHPNPEALTGDRATMRIRKDRFDEDKHELVDGEPEPSDSPEPTEELKDAVGTRQANRLAEAGLPTIEEALAYDGDLTALEGVGDATVEDLIDAAE